MQNTSYFRQAALMTLLLFVGACSSGSLEVVNEPDPDTASADTTSPEAAPTESPTEAATEAPTAMPTPLPTPTTPPAPTSTPVPEPTAIEVPDGQVLASTDLISPEEMEEVVATVVGCEPQNLDDTSDPDTFGCQNAEVRVLAFDHAGHGAAGAMGAALQRRNIDDPEECHLAFTAKNWALDITIDSNASPDRLAQGFDEALDPVFHSLCSVDGFGTSVDQLVHPDFASTCAASFHYAEEAVIAWSRAAVAAADEPTQPVHAFTCDLAPADDPSGTFDASVSFLQFTTEANAAAWADWAAANDDFCWQTAVLRDWVVRAGAPRFENDFVDPDLFDQVVADASVPASLLLNC